MKILFLAPQPFYEERGTPIAVKWAAEGLAELGHEVDLVTYHCGKDIDIPGVRQVRAWGPSAMRSVPIAFSWKKVFLDFFLSLTALRQVRKNEYDVVHAVEESIFPALILSRIAGAKLVYDMDSSMSSQMGEKWRWLKTVLPILRAMEKTAIRGADLVLPVCESLADTVSKWNLKANIMVLHDRAIDTDPDMESGGSEDIRAMLPEDAFLVLYVGNLEHYQGMDMVIEAMAKTVNKDLHLCVIGGEPNDIEYYRSRAHELELEDRVHLLGPRPIGHIQSYLEQADVLISARITGTNTPMKIYSYMLSGRPIVATDIFSHTQVLDKSCAMLVSPDASLFAGALEALASDPDLGRSLGEAAKARAIEKHTREAYNATLARAYGLLEN